MNRTTVPAGARRLALAAATALILPAVAMADHFEHTVRKQLAEFEKSVAGQGLALTHDLLVDQLEPETRDTLTLTLDKGITYALVGVCDDDCADLDLQLLDDKGKLVDSDELEDDTPVVAVLPARTAEYTLHVDMVDCDADTCFYGLAVYGKE